MHSTFELVFFFKKIKPVITENYGKASEVQCNMCKGCPEFDSFAFPKSSDLDVFVATLS